MQVISVVIAVFSLLGAADRIIGNKFGIGKEFEKGFYMLGDLTFAMLGMLIIAPVISEGLKGVLSYLPVEPSLVMSTIFSSDNGGAFLAKDVALDPKLGYFNGLVVASMLGNTVSFTIPFALSAVDKQHHRPVLLGMLCGIVTIPVGCAVGGLICGISLVSLAWNLLPLLIFSAVIAFGLALFPDACVKVFGFIGTLIKIIITFGIAVGVVRLLTGFEIIPGTTPLLESAGIIFNAAVVMTGAFPIIYILSKVLAKPLAFMGKRMKVNETSVTGLVGTLATSITTFDMVKDMDTKGIIINSAFAISAAFVFTDHMAFAMSFNGEYLGAVIAGKLISGICAVLVAQIVYKSMYKNTANNN